LPGDDHLVSQAERTIIAWLDIGFVGDVLGGSVLGYVLFLVLVAVCCRAAVARSFCGPQAERITNSRAMTRVVISAMLTAPMSAQYQRGVNLSGAEFGEALPGTEGERSPSCLLSVRCLSGIENAFGGEPFCRAFQSGSVYQTDLLVHPVPPYFQ
jgi:hypothetical protein